MPRSWNDLDDLERWDAVTTSPRHPDGDIGVTVCRYNDHTELVDKFEFSFYRDTDEAGDVYRSLSVQPDSTELDADVINRAKFCAGVQAADETGARASAGPFFSQRYLDAIPDHPGEQPESGDRSPSSYSGLADRQKARLLDAILDRADVDIGELLGGLDD